ncbi:MULTISPECIES: TfoX/Sxy family protein [unclassified Luteococcus]|uniref:TfoX/Sxy family protein n=1 Tax=unclassified Luteococcus TaxID=2639923 RepID=UPI00313D7D84
MPHDETLAYRIRELLNDQPSLREVKMFGGLAFMVDDRMVVCASAGGGALLVRVSPEDDPQLLNRPGARRGEMGKGRTMGVGWIAVDAEAIETNEDLEFWIHAALRHHATQ